MRPGWRSFVLIIISQHIYYAYLPRDKAEKLSEIESDYFYLQDQARRDVAGFRMPGDDAKLKLINDEKQRDMEALLTPDEKKAYDSRNGTTAYQLQRAIAGFDATQGEFDTIYALKQGVAEKFPLDTALMGAIGGANMTEFYRARQQAEAEVETQIKEALGEDRYADYVRGQRQDYQTLLAAAQRFNFSADTVAQTYQVRDNTASQARQISDDKSLNAAQKTEAYAALAEQATGQIRAALGNEAGDAYIDNALGWLKNLPKGGTVWIDSRGNVNVSQPKPKSR